MNCTCGEYQYPSTSWIDACPIHGMEGHTFYRWDNGEKVVVYKGGWVKRDG